MGIIKRTLGAALITGSAVLGYTHGSTSIIYPLPQNDPLWSSKTYARFNKHNNPSTQDVCIRRIPLDKIRPELLEKEGDLAVEFCRGVWAGWGGFRCFLSDITLSLCLEIQFPRGYC